MAAGLTRKQYKDRVYGRLKSIQRKLKAAGVPTLYKAYQLFPDMTDNKQDLGFNIWYRKQVASNGECAGMLEVKLWINGRKEYYGNDPDLDYVSKADDGIKRIIYIFTGCKVAADHTCIGTENCTKCGQNMDDLRVGPDFKIQPESNFYLLRPQTKRAEAWITEHISDEATYWGNAPVVDQHYILSIIDHITDDGLTFRKA